MTANTPQKNTLTMPEELTIYQVSQLKESILSALSKDDALCIDLSIVEEIDSAGLQLMIMAKREANRQSKTLSLMEHSPAVMNLFRLFNVSLDLSNSIAPQPRGTHV